MSLRFQNALSALLVALPLALAGCGNSGPLVMPDSIPSDEAPQDLNDGQSSNVKLPVGDPIPDVDVDDEVDVGDGDD